MSARSADRQQRGSVGSEESERTGRSKIEGGGTDAPPSLCLHIGLRGTAAQEGSAVIPDKLLGAKGFSRAAYATLRSDANGACDEAKSR